MHVSWGRRDRSTPLPIAGHHSDERIMFVARRGLASSNVARTMPPPRLFAAAALSLVGSVQAGRTWFTPHVSQVVKFSRVHGIRCMSSLSEEDKALYTIGANVGAQLQDLKCLSESELDVVLMGMKDILLDDVSFDVTKYGQQAAAIFKSKQEKLAKEMAEAGEDALKAAAEETGAQKTLTGLIYQETVAGSGESPTKEDTVRVHYEGRLVDGTVRATRRHGPTDRLTVRWGR